MLLKLQVLPNDFIEITSNRRHNKTFRLAQSPPFTFKSLVIISYKSAFTYKTKKAFLLYIYDKSCQAHFYPNLSVFSIQHMYIFINTKSRAVSEKPTEPSSSFVFFQSSVYKDLFKASTLNIIFHDSLDRSQDPEYCPTVHQYLSTLLSHTSPPA